MSRRLLGVFALALLVGASAGTGADAQQPGGQQPNAQQPGGAIFGLRPSMYGKTTLEEGHFQYAVKAGTSVQDAVEVINLTDERQEIELYPADLEQTDDGTVSPAQATDDMKTVGKWMELERDSVSVPANGRKYVSFTVDVPKGIPPGDYLGAVVGSVDVQRAVGGFTVESRVALTARVRVPGQPELAAEIGPLRVSDKGRTFTVELRNTGNLFFTTVGTVDIQSGGRRVASLRLSPPDVYLIPDGRATFRARWTSAPVFGKRTAVASFDTRSPGDEFDRLSSEAVALSYAPTTSVVLIVLAAIGIALLLLVLRRTTSTSPAALDRELTPSGRP